jgi:hypothetical protein
MGKRQAASSILREKGGSVNERNVIDHSDSEKVQCPCFFKKVTAHAHTTTVRFTCGAAQYYD